MRAGRAAERVRNGRALRRDFFTRATVQGSGTNLMSEAAHPYSGQTGHTATRPKRARVTGKRRRPSKAAARLRKTSRPLVLIVDDDVDARAMYGEYLRAMGCVVFTASNGAVAIEKASALRPDVIVMDLAMPKVDGWTATSRLKASDRTQRIPVIALSAVELSRDSASAAGCDGFLAKPCLPELLWWQIRAVLGPRLRRVSAEPASSATRSSGRSICTGFRTPCASVLEEPALRPRKNGASVSRPHCVNRDRFVRLGGTRPVMALDSTSAQPYAGCYSPPRVRTRE